MKIKDCIKGFSDDAISKVISPARTCGIVFEKLRRVTPAIYVRHFPVMRPSRIPQYFVQGTGHFKKLTNQEGANGKGHTETQALASGLMELAERYSCKKFFFSRKPLVASFGDLRDNPYKLKDVYAHCPGNNNAGLISDREAERVRVRWYKASTLRGEPVYLPVPLAGYLVLGTTGMAAGNSLEEAVSHGICEVVERHLKALIEFGTIIVPTIDAATIDNPVAGELLKRFRALGHAVMVKDFSLGFGLPAVGVVREIKKKDYAVTVGVAASRDEALVRALTENSQGEGSREENQRKASAIKHLLARTKRIPWSAVPDIRDRNIKVEVDRMEALLERQGMKVYCVDTTDPALDVPAVFVVITGAKVLDARLDRHTILGGLMYESFWLDDTAAVDRLLDTAEKNDPRNRPFYWVNRAISLRRQSRYSEAIKYFKKYVRLTKHGFSLYDDQSLRRACLFNLGICSLALRRQEKAAGYFRKLVAAERDFSLFEIRALYESIPSLAKDIPLLDRAEKLIQKTRETVR